MTVIEDYQHLGTIPLCLSLALERNDTVDYTLEIGFPAWLQKPLLRDKIEHAVLQMCRRRYMYSPDGSKATLSESLAYQSLGEMTLATATRRRNTAIKGEGEFVVDIGCF